MADVIDAHHHLWRYQSEDYPWIGAEMTALMRDFTPEDLRREMRAAGVAGTVAVQARQTLEETRWLLDAADRFPAILGVVGWAPLRDEDLPALLEPLLSRPKLRGLRHVVQDEPEDDFLLGEAFNRGIDSLQRSGLVYDLLIRASQLPAACQFVEQHPKQAFVLDHLAKPSIRAGDTSKWQAGFERLASYPNVSCKLSGLVTEANWSHWSAEDIVPYLDIAWRAFGADRLMAGSDWPVCLLASSYKRWWDILLDWSAKLPQEDRAAILGGTATRVYRLSPLDAELHEQDRTEDRNG